MRTRRQKTVGKMVEAFGPVMYLGTYFLTAIGGNYAAITRMRPRPGYGASGAVMGLYGFMCCHFYRYQEMEECKVRRGWRDCNRRFARRAPHPFTHLSTRPSTHPETSTHPPHHIPSVQLYK